MLQIKFFFRQMAKLLIQNIILPVVYFFASSKDADGSLVVFADAHHDGLPDSMTDLYTYLKEREENTGGSVHITTFFRDFGKLSSGEQLKTSIRFMKLYAKAGCVVLCDNFLPVSACKKRKETKVVQLWHGPGAYKKFGYDTKDDIPSFYKSNVFANYDLVTVSGQRAVAPFTSAMRQEAGVVRPIGVSRMDRWFDEAALLKDRELFVQMYPEAAGKKVLLWVPTFRGNAGVPSLDGLDSVKKLGEVLGDEWFVIISLHPHLLTYADYAAYKQKMTSSQILPSADLVVTDYSSILYDAVILKKKLLIFAPDMDSFFAKRGSYMKPEEIPAMIVQRDEELKSAVLETDASYGANAAAAFYESWLAACDGKATERIAEYILSRN